MRKSGTFGSSIIWIECFWKILKSIFHIRSMQLQGNGLYTALLIKVLAYLLAIRLQAHWPFSQLTITQIMRQHRSESRFERLDDDAFSCRISNNLRILGKSANFELSAQLYLGWCGMAAITQQTQRLLRSPILPQLRSKIGRSVKAGVLPLPIGGNKYY